MAVSENDFQEIQGDSYRGSRYGNFVGGGITPQGNVSSGAAENAANAVGTSRDISQDAPPTPTSPSQGLIGEDAAATPRMSDMVIGAALPYAGSAIGQAAGAAIGAGASFGSGMSQGFSNLASNVSGGLLGTASTPTNIALSNMGGAYGPATSGAVNSATSASNIGSLGSGANIGAAVGGGLATAAATLLTGGSVKDAAKAGVGTAVGTAVGNAILPGIGGFVGGFIGGLFCFVAGTPILMADGTQKLVEELEFGDEVLHGGKVMAYGKSLSTDLYSYKNTVMTAKHAVFHDGQWVRVEDIDGAEPVLDIPDGGMIAYPIVTENSLLITPWFVSADVLETPLSTEEGLSYDEIIEHLNTMTDRNAFLANVEKEVCVA